MIWVTGRLLTGVKKMHSKFLFIIVFFIDFLLSAFNYISNFITKEINSAQLCDSLLYSFLGLLPIVPLVLISAKITKMSDVKKLLFTKFILIVYLIIDISSGVLLYNPHFPKYIRIPFYSSSWFFYVKYIMYYRQYQLIPRLLIQVFYWTVFYLLLKEITNRVTAVKNKNID